MKAIAVLFISACIAGCATNSQNYHWEKYGASGYDFSTDQGQCRAQAFSVPGASLMQAVLVYENCLQGKGWYKVASQ